MEQLLKNESIQTEGGRLINKVRVEIKLMNTPQTKGGKCHNNQREINENVQGTKTKNKLRN